MAAMMRAVVVHGFGADGGIALGALPAPAPGPNDLLIRIEAVAVNFVDLLVIDAAALREARQLTSQVIRSVQSCTTPVLWLDDDQAPDPPKRQKLEVVTRPIEREAFHSALEALLTGKSRLKGRASAEAKARTGGEKVKEKKRASGKQSSEEPIDLFDVVEEERKPAKPKRNSRRKKR